MIQVQSMYCAITGEPQGSRQDGFVSIDRRQYTRQATDKLNDFLG